MLFVPIFTVVPKLHPGLPETRFNLGTPEKNAKADPKVDMGSRSRSSSSTSTSPKPLLQSPKPSLAARPTIPQKPRTALRPGKDFSGQGVTPRTVASQDSWDGNRRWFPELPVNVGSAEGVMRSLPEAVELTKAGRFFYSAARPPSLRLSLHSVLQATG